LQNFPPIFLQIENYPRMPENKFSHRFRAGETEDLRVTPKERHRIKGLKTAATRKIWIHIVRVTKSLEEKDDRKLTKQSQ